MQKDNNIFLSIISFSTLNITKACNLLNPTGALGTYFPLLTIFCHLGIKLFSSGPLVMKIRAY